MMRFAYSRWMITFSYPAKVDMTMKTTAKWLN
jgi:hypothetical protein